MAQRGARLLEDLVGEIRLDHDAVGIEELHLHEGCAGNRAREPCDALAVQAGEQRPEAGAGKGHVIERSGGERRRRALQQMQHGLPIIVEPGAVQGLHGTCAGGQPENLLIKVLRLGELLRANIEMIQIHVTDSGADGISSGVKISPRARDPRSGVGWWRRDCNRAP